MGMERRGDTTIIRYYHSEYKTDYRAMLRELTDSLSAMKTDSVRVPYPVEKKLTRWQQVKMDYGGMAMGGTAVLVLFVVAWLAVKIRNR